MEKNMNGFIRLLSISLYDSGIKFTTDESDIEPKNLNIRQIVNVQDLIVRRFEDHLAIVVKRNTLFGDKYDVIYYSGSFAGIQPIDVENESVYAELMNNTK